MGGQTGVNAMPCANDLSREEPHEAPRSVLREICATRTIVSTMGILLALGGLDHGLFEALQGNAPTPGLLIRAIGPRQQMWPYGTEDAFTLLPTFLLSGIASIVLSLLIAVWSVGFVHRKHGSAVFLLLSVLLFLTGGGVAQAIFFVLAWAVSLHIYEPVAWIDRLLPKSNRKAFGKLWPGCLGAFTLLSAAALEIAITGYAPGLRSPELVLHFCWWLLAVGLCLLLVGIASGFVHDANRGSQCPAASALPLKRL